jgi:hypothetical protein
MLRQHPPLSQWIDLAAGRRQERVQSQALVIVDVLIAQSRAKDALAQQFLHRMIDPSRGALVVKALRQFPGQPKVDVNLTQQQRAGIGGEGAAGKIGRDFA